MESTEESVVAENGEPKPKKTKYSLRQWTILFVFGIVNFLDAATFSMQSPFFPAEAESKGATATEYGLIFGTFQLAVFICSPILGKYINKIGPQNVLSGGLILSSVAVVCFGLTDRIQDRTTFVIVGFICRCLDGIGATGIFIATFTITACEFSDAKATTVAILETFLGVGAATGPTIGAALYTWGGFPLPFMVSGVAIFCWGLIALALLPKTDKAVDNQGNNEGYSVWTILKITPVALVTLSTVITSINWNFFSAILEPYIRQLTSMEVGLVFVVGGVVYSVSSPVIGFICDRVTSPIYVSILGSLLSIVAYLLVGPASGVPVKPTLWVTIIGLAVSGLSFGCCMIANYLVATKESIKYGLPENIATCGVVSGLWNSAVSLGAFLGPPIGGVLFDYLGLRHASWVIITGSGIVGIAMLIYILFYDNARESQEFRAILTPVPTTHKKLETSKSLKYGSDKLTNKDDS